MKTICKCGEDLHVFIKKFIQEGENLFNFDVIVKCKNCDFTSKNILENVYYSWNEDKTNLVPSEESDLRIEEFAKKELANFE